MPRESSGRHRGAFRLWGCPFMHTKICLVVLLSDGEGPCPLSSLVGGGWPWRCRLLVEYARTQKSLLAAMGRLLVFLWVTRRWEYKECQREDISLEVTLLGKVTLKYPWNNFQSKVALPFALCPFRACRQRGRVRLL